MSLFVAVHFQAGGLLQPWLSLYLREGGWWGIFMRLLLILLHAIRTFSARVTLGVGNSDEQVS